MSFSNGNQSPQKPIESDSLAHVLSELVDVLRAHKTNYALIGGLAVSVRGRVRSTRDIDLLLDVPQLELPRLLDDLQQRGFEFDLRTLLSEWSHGITQLTWRGRIRVDWLKPVVVQFQHVLDRATEVPLNDQRVRVADVEGLILLKLTAWRPQDQEDVRGLLAKHAGQLDLDGVRREISPLTELSSPMLGEFEAIVCEFYGPATQERPHG
ncbi:MAG: nucleotidyltransferase [Planctomycetia bacterium]|nr:nucleotidyltransferase [Planctomycetia bacterium]